LLYHLYEMNHAAVAPLRAAANVSRQFWNAPMNPLSDSYLGRAITAGIDVFERVTRRYGKPQFGIDETIIDGERIAVEEGVVWRKPFCELLHFRKKKDIEQPKLLIVAPMSGHYATLLRGTVKRMVQEFDVYITDWADARMVPMTSGRFDLDDYVDYVIEMLQELGPNTSVMAVCQPSVPVLAAASVMAESDDPAAPAAMILMGGPIDTRRNPTEVNKLASQHDIDWFRRHVISTVPFGYPGFGREVYPGFIQLTGFMTMNLDRHISAHQDLFWHLVQGDGDSAEKHERFYDEYLSVMDLTAEFYLQTVENVFIKQQLPKGELRHRGELVKPEAITKTALMTVEGELDDISGVGQTQAAHELCRNVPAERRQHYLQPGVGHYGVFNGSRFNTQIAPRIANFIRDSLARG
jgi:poly(3-hydroxybutyrate) depolymerase